VNLDRLRSERWLLRAIGGILAAFLLLPLVALFAMTTWSAFDVGIHFALVLPALRLSLKTTMLSLTIVLVLGTPLSWVLGRASGRLVKAFETAVQLPIVIPPAVAGVALLLAFGRRGMLTGHLYPSSWVAAFSSAAVVMAEVFVSAPFYIQAATSAFRRIDPRLIVVARSFGATPLRIFFSVAIPLSAPGLLAGAAMSWARALGEFGATLMFAGNLEGKTQTLPLAIYTALEVDVRAAQAISIVLVVVAFALLLCVRALLAQASRNLEVRP